MLDPNLFASPNMRDAIVSHDIATVYRILTRNGIAQREIAELTGQLPSEVSEILSGRRVSSYALLERIAEGLGIPREWMGLSYGNAPRRGANSAPGRTPQNRHVVESEHVGEEVTEEMKRRALLAAGSVALLGAPALGSLLQLPPAHAETPLPSRLVPADVTAVKKLTTELQAVARTYGGGADVVTQVANKATDLLSVPTSDPTKAAMEVAVAELHTMAGWCCVDSGHHDTARAHFATAMDVLREPANLRSAEGTEFAARRAAMASAFRHAGIQMIDADAHNDGLKAYQLGLTALGGSDPHAAAWLHGESAIPLVAMGYTESALKALSTARETRFNDAFDDADMDYLTSAVYRRLGRLDTAERFAAHSVRKWNTQTANRRDGINADISLATVHVLTGERDGATLAHRSIVEVAGLRSVRAKTTSLTHLVTALETRNGSDYKELANLARSVSI